MHKSSHDASIFQNRTNSSILPCALLWKPVPKYSLGDCKLGERREQQNSALVYLRQRWDAFCTLCQELNMLQTKMIV